MKQFASWLLAAIAGSVITLAVNHYARPTQPGVIIERSSGIPAAQVAYTVNEKGEAVPLDFTGVADKVTKAVVHIKSSSQGRITSRNDRSDPIQEFFFGPGNPFEQRGPQVGTGSGVIINPEGYIVTNNHVVQGAEVVEVTLNDNRVFKAEVIGTDPDTDLAVIKISQKSLPHLSFVNSDEAKVGEWVLAVGNPFNLNSTVTAGIISAKGRNINIINSNRSMEDLERNGNTAIESFIQTDAAINPGNSGGALVNLNGGLIGINTAIASNTGSYAGYGFAVPANIVSKVTEDLIAYGTVQRGWLGVQVTSVTQQLAKENDLSVSEGAYVSDFADKSSAKEAGIEKGDVIVKLDETDIKSSTALIEYIGRKRPGDKVNVTVNRGGKTKAIPVTLKTRDGEIGTVKRDEKDALASLGITLEDMDSKTLKSLELASGVKVKALDNGKVARYTDMREGFIITHIDEKPVKSAKDANELLKTKKTGEAILFGGVYENFPREYIYALRM
ncbi:MAG: Do family serine endopeptidase [Cyclobacteriaceae bacterium]|jgi:Do/DeqQ family serine protease|nr:Do family serine endopeptidase [Cyclobacteriaceae bacterium]